MINERGPIDWPLLARFVSSECSETEAAEVQAWLREDPEHDRLLAEVRSMLNLLDEQEPELDAEAAWQRLEARLDRPSVIPLPTAAAPSSPGGWKRRRPSAAIAAAFGALIAAGALAVLGPPAWPGDPRADGHAFSTGPGERGTAQFGDGTKIRLSVDTEVRIKPGFGSNHRVVELRGEAFFDVAPDPKRPFIVHAEGTVTRVLGTQFGMTAYPESGQVHVVVEEGSVAFGTAEDGLEGSAQLRRGQLGRWIHQDGEVRVEEVDVAMHLGWLHNRLVFDDEPLDAVVRRISRWYGVDIVLADPTLAGYHFTASLDDPTLTAMVSVLTLTLGLTYERDDGRIILRPSTPSASATPHREEA